TGGEWVQKPASTGVNVDYSLFFTSLAGTSNDVQQLRPNGFQVGLAGEVPDRTNESGIVYYWAAFGPRTEPYYPSLGVAADYTLNTVSVTSGSTAVSGSGTAWRSANRGRGDRITINGVDYTVLTVKSETQLVLTTPFVGTSGSYAYTIARQFTT